MKVKDLIPLVENDTVVIDNYETMTSEAISCNDAIVLYAARSIDSVYTTLDDICIVILPEGETL